MLGPFLSEEFIHLLFSVLGNLPGGMKLEFAKLVCCPVLRVPGIPSLTENGQGDLSNYETWP